MPDLTFYLLHINFAASDTLNIYVKTKVELLADFTNICNVSK